MINRFHQWPWTEQQYGSDIVRSTFQCTSHVPRSAHGAASKLLEIVASCQNVSDYGPWTSGVRSCIPGSYGLCTILSRRTGGVETLGHWPHKRHYTCRRGRFRLNTTKWAKACNCGRYMTFAPLKLNESCILWNSPVLCWRRSCCGAGAGDADSDPRISSSLARISESRPDLTAKRGNECQEITRRRR